MDKRKLIEIKYRRYPRGIEYEDGYVALNLVGDNWLDYDNMKGVIMQKKYRLKDFVLLEFYNKKNFILLATVYMREYGYVIEFAKPLNIANITLKSKMGIQHHIVKTLKEHGYNVKIIE